MTINTKDYYNLIAPQYITWDFYSKYILLEPPFGELGLPVFLRTYSRFIKELNRREKWCETILRNIEYSLSLDNISSDDSKKKEAESLFEMMFNMRGFPSGRSLWTAGTPQTTKDPSSSWNCTFKVIDNLSAFSEIFYWLLIGAGTGFSVENKYISKLPKFNPDITIKHDDYFYLKDDEDGSHLVLTKDDINPNYIYLSPKSIINDDDNFINEDLSTYTNAKLTIGDSKEDWCNALRCFLHLLTYSNIKTITFNYNLIRPEGTLIKTFGGRASGHKALLEMFNNILMIIKRCNGVLDSVGVLDIANSIGLNVVSGGVRRTAEIGLGDANDNNFITAKLNLYDDPDKVQYRAIRSMSNNSILFYENPGLDKIKDVMTSIKSNGEPGFWIIGNANLLAESPIAGTNPCAEAGLDDGQSCNLTTKNVKAHVYFNKKTKKWEYNWELGKKTIELITRIGSRQTTATQWHPRWDELQKRDRLLGVSMTGLMDAFDLLEWDTEQQEYYFKWVKLIAINAANEYHNYLGINRSTRVTLMKPEGTISQLPTVSSGIHRAYSPYYLRRVRFSKTDPLARVLLNLGLTPVPENNQGDSLFASECTTWVFTFPIKTNTTIRAIDESAIDQLERYKLAQVNYADRGHNISATITLAPDEYDIAANWINDNWNDIIGVSFLPRFDPISDGKASYPLMPYEPITEYEYHNLFNVKLTETELIEILAKIENKYEEQSLDSSCSTGACPIR
jgi:adenosylcobalamin-dependent ribonucleoside-triphosphate reductase